MPTPPAPTTSTTPTPTPLTPTQQASNNAMITSGNYTFANSTAGAPAPISADTLSKPTNPINIPAAPAPTPSMFPTIPPPNGTQVDSNGMATIPPLPANSSSTDTQSYIKNALSQLGGELGTKGATESNLNTTYDISGKTAQATSDYNLYNKAKIDQTNQLAAMKEQSGGTTGGNTEAMANFQYKSNANLSNLAYQAQVSQGLLTDAQKTISDKITAQFQPITDQIDFLTKFASVNNNDMTDSQKAELQTKTDQMKTDQANVQSTLTSVSKALQDAGTYTKAASTIDAVMADYSSGKITAIQAQEKINAAAAPYVNANAIAGNKMLSVDEAAKLGVPFGTLAKDAYGKGGGASTTYTPGANPVVDSHITNVLNGNETMAQVPANLRNDVSVGLTQQPISSYSPLAASRFTTASTRITNQFTNMSAYQLTANGGVYLDRINAALQTPGSVSDQDLLDSLTKLNTGGNAISDAQVKIITDGKSFADSVSVIGNKLANGGVLSDNQRQQINKIAKAIFANYQKSYEPIYKQASAQLTAAGIPKPFWTIPDLNTLSTNTNGGGVSAGGNSSTAQSFSIGGQTVNVGQQVQYSDGKTGTVQSDGSIKLD